MAKSIKKNYIYNLSYHILTLITPIITMPYLARVLGADGIGTISFAESIVSYFVLAGTLGITTFGQREISYYQDDIDKRSIAFWNTKLLEIITASMALILYFCVAMMQANRIIYLVLAFHILAVVVDVTWLMQGMEEFGKIVGRNVIIKLLSVVYIFAFVKTPEDLPQYALGGAFFLFLGNVSLWGYVPHYVKKVKFSELRLFKDLPAVVLLFIPTIAIQIYTVLDKTMIGIITSNAYENGYYEQALKVSRVVLSIVTSLGTVMIPRIGYLYKQKKQDEVVELMMRSYRFVWFAGIPLCFGLAMVANNFVPWFFGAGYDKVASLLAISSLLIPIIGISNVTGVQYLIPTQRQRQYTFSVIIGAITNFVANLFLINLWGAIGAMTASVLAETIIAVVQIIIVRKELSPKKIILQGKKYVCAGLIMIIALLPLRGYLSASILHTVVMVLVGGVVYIGVLLIWKDEFLKSFVSKVGKNNK